MASWGVNFPDKNGPIPLWLALHLITWKSPLPPFPTNVYALPSHINMTTMIRQNTRFPPTTRPPGKPDHHGITWSRANFGPLQRGSVTNSILIIVWYLFDPKVTGSLGLSWDPSDSECSALTHFSMSLAQKSLFPHAKLFYEKSFPMFCRGRRGTMLYLQIFSHF